MSSMATRFSISFLAIPALLASAACQANDGRDWDEARSNLIASQPSGMAQVVDQWELLSSNENLGFTSYAGFLLAYPDFPEEAKLRRSAETALTRDAPDAGQMIAYFDRYPPLGNPARGRFAIALMQAGRSDAVDMARAAWRGGPLTDGDEAMILAQYGPQLTQADHDARMDALLWAGATTQAERALGYVSLDRRTDFATRFALLGGNDYGAASGGGNLEADPGYIYQRARYLRRSNNGGAAQRLLANRQPLASLPTDPDKWVEELLVNARGAAAAGDHGTAVRIASRIDDGFAPGTDISQLGLGIRDDYTSLMWLGGTSALWRQGSPREAAQLFYRYGAAARTPQTKSKGFYWAGKAMADAGQRDEAARYFEMAAANADYFYGQLALERLGRPMPSFAAAPAQRAPADARRAFEAQPVTQAVNHVARYAPWKTTVRFFRAIADAADTEQDFNLLADHARAIGRRDLGVIMGQAARGKGHAGFQHVAFPLMPLPPGYENNFTMIHALTRQESQFSQNALSHAGARGLMQLMPGTAREQAGKQGLGYSLSGLTDDPQYNIQLGSGYFARMLDYYGGSYPLAIGAYNAGPGNVNRWLRANGDPRTGSIGWLEWMERIPISETRNYVQRVIENAVVYDAMNPAKANYRGDNPVSHYLGKNQPG